MKRILKALKKPVAAIIGIGTGTGSFFAGFDPTTAIIAAIAAFLLVAGIEIETIKQWKEIVDNDGK